MKKFKIYQLPVKHKAKFMDLEFVNEHNIMPKLEEYKIVWEGEMDLDEEKSINAQLDTIYCRFNLAHPEDFKGHSLSQSDIVEIDGKYFYCDFYSWKEVTFTSIKEEEAKRYGTTVESLEEQGFIFMEEACGDCHWFASCAELGGSLMSLAWYREQQKNFHNEHFKKNKEEKEGDEPKKAYIVKAYGSSYYKSKHSTREEALAEANKLNDEYYQHKIWNVEEVVDEEEMVKPADLHKVTLTEPHIHLAKDGNILYGTTKIGTYEKDDLWKKQGGTRDRSGNKTVPYLYYVTIDAMPTDRGKRIFFSRKEIKEWLSGKQITIDFNAA